MTGGADLNDLYRAIGKLEGEVSALRNQWGEQDRKATEGRKMLYEKVEELGTKVTTVTGEVGEIKRDIADFKPIVDETRDRHQRSVGSKKTIAVVWAAFVGIVGAVTGGLIELAHYFWHGPTPPTH